MKSIILVVACLSMATTGFSQFNKGDKLLVGGFSIQTDKRSSTTTLGSANEFNVYSVNPAIGFFLNDKTALGIRLGYSNTFSKDFIPGYYNSENNSNSYYGGIMIRRYFLLSEKFYFLIDGSIGYSKGDNTSTTIDYGNGFNSRIETKTSEFSTAVTPKFVFFPSPKWGIEAGIGSVSYSNTSYNTSSGSSNRLYINYGVFTLGFAYYLRK